MCSTGLVSRSRYLSSQTFATYPAAAHAIDVVAHIMTHELPAFYRMVPADELLIRPVPDLTFCLAEHGSQYVVYSDAGEPFTLRVSNISERSTQSYNLTWFEAASGASEPGGILSSSGSILLNPPRVGVHWVAMLLRVSQRAH